MDKRSAVAGCGYGEPDDSGPHRKSQPKARDGDDRTAAQRAQERAMGEVSDTLLCIEQAIDRAKRGLKNNAKHGADGNVDLALTDALNELQRIHKRLMKDTYFAGDALRLL